MLTGLSGEPCTMEPFAKPKDRSFLHRPTRLRLPYRLHRLAVASLRITCLIAADFALLHLYWMAVGFPHSYFTYNDSLSTLYEPWTKAAHLSGAVAGLGAVIQAILVIRASRKHQPSRRGERWAPLQGRWLNVAAAGVLASFVRSLL